METPEAPKAVDLSSVGNNLGISALTGFCVSMFIMLSYFGLRYLDINFNNPTVFYTWFIIFIIYIYGITFGFTILAQQTRCKQGVSSDGLANAAMGSFWTLIYVLCTYVIVMNLEFVRSLVESCRYDDTLGTVNALEAAYPWAKYGTLSYYVFFFTMIGQIQGGGMSVKCD